MISDESLKDIYKLLRQETVIKVDLDLMQHLEMIGMNCDYQEDHSLSLISPHLYYPPYKIEILYKQCPFIAQIKNFFITTSTLDHLEGVGGGPQLLLAEYQSKGRGQYSRSWGSYAGRQIQMTFGPFCYTGGLSSSLWVAACALRALGEFFPDHQVLFKWPNDLYLLNKKCAGFLINQLKDEVVVSWGLNLTTPSGFYGALYPSYHIPHREDLIIRFLTHLMDYSDQSWALGLLNDKSFFAEEERVIVKDRNGNFIYQEAFYKGVSSDGACILMLPREANPVVLYNGSLQRFLSFEDDATARS